ncbi:unnamed protein product [Acanthoscelides obtectus]|uniref:Uncharacterized protein n=1 Tax=Acanthoscelides obtectus TaxID=200917 RepID=A0A9P0LUB4_ACAOB|nr:unnamed protein product [Acanthoscelides obtectus]CAK1686124.1 hypothetical protein AOBTE_LOCUS35798 [Acanthoscelides obtectus]
MCTINYTNCCRKLNLLCHIRLASISSWLVAGNLIHPFDCATMLFTTLSTVPDTIA